MRYFIQPIIYAEQGLLGSPVGVMTNMGTPVLGPKRGGRHCAEVSVVGSAQGQAEIDK